MGLVVVEGEFVRQKECGGGGGGDGDTFHPESDAFGDDS